jgi:hypothetical protein
VSPPAKLLGYGDVPSDHYLWLTGQAGRILRGEMVAEQELYKNTARIPAQTGKR